LEKDARQGMSTEDLASFLDELADAASKAIMPHFRSLASVENKAGRGYDPVTVADRAAEEVMRDLIGRRFPGHGIIGEEYGNERADAEFVWVLDPIDGTRSFIAGLPVWGTLIGLLHAGRPALGMMVQPFTGERFAGDGTRSWYRGPTGAAPLKARPCAALSDAILFTTTPALFQGAERQAYDRVEHAVRLPRYGTDCYAYCMVAAGHVDLVIEAGLKPYDVIPLIPIITGAGGIITTWDGAPAKHGGRIVAAGDRRVHAAAMEMLAGQAGADTGANPA
jgi:histidinol phosphatase-like enzyme (inositol monophosphatase family)